MCVTLNSNVRFLSNNEIPLSIRHSSILPYLLLFHSNIGFVKVPQCYNYTYIACLFFQDASFIKNHLIATNTFSCTK